MFIGAYIPVTVRFARPENCKSIDVGHMHVKAVRHGEVLFTIIGPDATEENTVPLPVRYQEMVKTTSDNDDKSI